MIKSGWEIVIGLEVHAQIASKSKLFSRAPTSFGADPNTNIELFDVAIPGTLPVLNKECIELAVLTALGVGAVINKLSRFDRKHYFYPDLPLGYQTTQFYEPIARDGIITIGSGKTIKIERLHIEQDAGKSIHDQSMYETFIDLNRAGIGLMEIVTAPDLRSAKEASEFLSKLRLILRYLNTCDGDMEKGSLRCDANVSVRPIGSDKYGNRVEIKNLNSLKFLEKAIEFEAIRQIAEIESGNDIIQETRLFDTNNLETRSMRLKEDAVDYRYFPDPDILPVELSDEYISSMKARLPELPDQKLKRYTESLNIPLKEALVLIAEKSVSEFFEKLNSLVQDSKLCTNWLIVELFARMNKLEVKIDDERMIKVHMLAQLLLFLKNNEISASSAKQGLDIMFESGKDPASIIKERSLMQISNHDTIKEIIICVLSENSLEVERYKNGEDRLFSFFVGQVMKIAKGKADPGIINELLKKLLP
ncbi:Aspartyl/glutamyl-tRNA(Asn/Gln) amidotransferase subunit B [Candidatus Cyrtobacter comes]|uniref:Aspartyl/glutamyl-tRNA(Asn/Gln) amidotransferase subunit B n=1 Tax=Candidatus Cyrtobacter comes TaxID=675776 RepID=A0ABU5L8N9_9RICK|nr:Asp-tRNA(Asn)/Glu-tRNA(Gln) amidotransferase subunit GatB [Candidatus Cyrtobacter comes]MDZ5762219.1 Aspartyl/glutamyl-tRNA(Asn/Gln) amidotransferase subunit B [Candidatus Cyrtobacter comes]